MNGAELARALAAGEGVPEYKARRAVRFIVAQIADTMRAGGSVSLAGLGKFEVKQIEPREYVNPKDGTKVFKAQRRFGVTLKTSPRLFNNPPSVQQERWLPPVWAAGVSAWAGVLFDSDDGGPDGYI